MFDHSYVGSPNRPLATIGFWYLDPIQRFSLRWCCDIMMAEPGRLRVIAEALSASQSPSSRNTFIANSLRGMKLMSLTLIAVANRGDVIELTYEETVGDPHPFVLTVTSHHISRQTSKLPIEASDLEAYVFSHATELQGAAEKCKSKGLTAEVLK